MRIARSYLTAMSLLVALVGCNQGEPGAASPETESAPSTAATSPGNLDTEAKAREFAATYINEQVSGQSFTDDEGNPVTPPPKVEADTWRLAEKNGDRWTLKRGPPGNWYFHVSVNVDGSNPESEAVYFAE